MLNYQYEANNVINIQTIKKGDIYLVDLSAKIKDKVSTSRQLGIRPCIINSNDVFNNSSNVISVIPCTKQDKKYSPVHVTIPTYCGLKIESLALVEQQVTVDQEDILWNKGRKGRCTSEILKEIDKAILIQNAINLQEIEPFNINKIIALASAWQHNRELISNLKNLYKSLDDKSKAVLKEEINKTINFNNNVITEFKNYCIKYNQDYKEFYYKYVGEKNTVQKLKVV